MLIIGCGGLALQMIDDLETQFGEDFMFWSDTITNKSVISNKYTIINREDQVQKVFKSDKRFIIAVGNPISRKRLCLKFEALGGECSSFISSKAKISNYAIVEAGNVILQSAIVEAGVLLGKGCLINTAAVITHECIVDEFSEIAPMALLAGNVRLGSLTFVGAHATILPKLNIGSNVTIGAKALVTKNVANNDTVFGMPAKPINK